MLKTLQQITKNINIPNVWVILKNPKTQRYILIAILIFIILWWRKDIQEYSQKLAFTKQNTLALNSQLRTWKTKYNTFITERFSLVGQIDSLKNYSSDLEKAIKKFEKEKKGKVVTGEKIDVGIDNSGDKTETKNDYNPRTKEGTLYWEFNRKEDGFSRYLVGEIPYKIEVAEDVRLIPQETILKKDIVELELYTYTFLNKDNSLVFAVESKSDKIKILDVKQFIDPDHLKKVADIYYEPPKYSFDVGIHGGFGINPNVNILQPIPYIGVGIGFNFQNLIRF